MSDTVAFIVKILILSSILSVLIKYGGRVLAINPTVMIAIAVILLPSIIMMLALGWRAQQKLSN